MARERGGIPTETLIGLRRCLAALPRRYQLPRNRPILKTGIRRRSRVASSGTSARASLYANSGSNPTDS